MIYKENREMRKKIENKKLIIENVNDLEFLNLIEINLNNKYNNNINELKKKIENYSFENKLLIEEKDKNYKEIEDLKLNIEELKNQLKNNPSSLNYIKTNSKISLSSFNKKEDNIEENEKLLSQYENENNIENEEKTLSKQENNISDINEQSNSQIQKKKSISKFSSKFKSKSITESEINNNNIQEEENINKNNNNNNNIISIETHELIKVFQYNKKIKWYLFKIKTNNNKEENYEDFIWKEQKTRKDFCDFDIPKND